MQEASSLPPSPAPRRPPAAAPGARPRPRRPGSPTPGTCNARTCARALRTALPAAPGVCEAPGSAFHPAAAIARTHAHVCALQAPSWTQCQQRGGTAPSRWEAKRGGREKKTRREKYFPTHTHPVRGAQSPRPAAVPAAYLRALQIEQRRQPPVDPSQQKVHGCRRTPRSGARRAPPRRRLPAAAASARSRPRLLRARRRLLGCRRPGAARGSGGRGGPLQGLRFHPSISPALRRPPLLLSVGAPPGRAHAPRLPRRRRRPAPAAGQSELHSGARSRPLSPRRGRQAGTRAALAWFRALTPKFARKVSMHLFSCAPSSRRLPPATPRAGVASPEGRG